MKIIVSTSSLRRILHTVDVDNITAIIFNYPKVNTMTFMTGDEAVHAMNVEIQSKEVVSIKQDNRRWDWMKELMTAVEEQPVVMDITESAVKVIFSY